MPDWSRERLCVIPDAEQVNYVASFYQFRGSLESEQLGGGVELDCAGFGQFRAHLPVRFSICYQRV